MFDTISVVIVDDVEEMRTMLRLSLEMDGRFEVVGEAENGLEALQLVQKYEPNAVVLDLVMPKMGGIQAIPRIVDFSPETKILALSSYDEHRRLKAMAAGAHDYTFKGEDFVRRVVLRLTSLCSQDHYDDDYEAASGTW
ncbi:MAG: response regulator transcription factor [Actinomycetota bacterium]